ncbi:lectin BRA-3-like [Pollicipes pollicipes]|uniref:lectin BRA-3-like n=1 Tax=Pollicipes pollicipes TaxID=41117 RepID=UPI0018854E86|nr:lectin BRA-3-like [Pollicipes pollicipes]
MLRAVVLATALLSSALGACPNNWVTYGLDCYWSSTYTATWRDARTACLAMASGSDLVSVHSAAEANFLFTQMGAMDTWIGLNDLSSENNFVWSDGSSVDFTNWMDGQPNNLLDQDCVNVQDPATGKWDDNHCKENKNFICKIRGSS